MIQEITAAEVWANLQNQNKQSHNKLSIIDVREQDEYECGTIPGAVHIPLGALPYRLDEIDKEQAHLILCRSGARSEKATMLLQQEGYDVTNIVGGMLAWNKNQ